MDCFYQGFHLPGFFHIFVTRFQSIWAVFYPGKWKNMGTETCGFSGGLILTHSHTVDGCQNPIGSEGFRWVSIGKMDVCWFFWRVSMLALKTNRWLHTVDGSTHHRSETLVGRFPCKYRPTMVFPGFKVVQDFVHPQYGHRGIPAGFHRQSGSVGFFGGYPFWSFQRDTERKTEIHLWGEGSIEKGHHQVIRACHPWQMAIGAPGNWLRICQVEF